MPEPTTPVVVNATPIITLSTVRQLDLLHQLYGEVLIPEAVHSELLAGGQRRVGVADLATRPWIRPCALRDPSRAELLLTDLDQGEAEVIALAQELQAGLVIIDERLARRHAERLHLPMTGTLGVLLKAKRVGLVSRLEPMIADIRAAGIRLGEDLVRRVIQLAGE